MPRSTIILSASFSGTAKRRKSNCWSAVGGTSPASISTTLFFAGSGFPGAPWCAQYCRTHLLPGIGKKIVYTFPQCKAPYASSPPPPMGPVETTKGARRSFVGEVTAYTVEGSTDPISLFVSTPPVLPAPPTALKVAFPGTSVPPPPAPVPVGLPPGDPRPTLLGAIASAP